jgi:hypothetical protein
MSLHKRLLFLVSTEIVVHHHIEKTRLLSYILFPFNQGNTCFTKIYFSITPLSEPGSHT